MQQQELCKVSSLRTEDYLDSQTGEVSARLVAELTRVVLDPLTKEYRPAFNRSTFVASFLPTVYVRGEKVPNRMWEKVREAHANGWAFPASVVTLSTSPFRFKTDPEGTVRETIRIMVLQPEGKELENYDEVQAIQRQAEYQLRGGNAFALDVAGKPTNTGVTITYKGNSFVASTEAEWAEKRVAAQANSTLRDAVVAKVKAAREAKLAAIQAAKLKAVQGAETEPNESVKKR